jgi:hypothetical protein
MEGHIGQGPGRFLVLLPDVVQLDHATAVRGRPPKAGRPGNYYQLWGSDVQGRVTG